MKTVLFFDTSIATLNTGDEIINVSIKNNWREIYNNNYVLRMATHTPNYYWWQNLIYKKHKIYENADYKFLCGTNILYTNMLRPEPAWNVFINNTRNIRNTICVGVGIGKNSKRINLYTKMLYKKILSKDYIHSVRDEAAKKLLESLGFKAINTGCPTLWGLTPEHCKEIPVKKCNSVVFTLTSYQPDYVNDKKMIEIIKRNYKNVYFWPQSINDYKYLLELKMNDNVKIISPNLEGYDEILNQEIDYVGNRLHGGIFALQHKCRTIIIGIDYRVEEMGKSFSIPFIMRDEINDNLEDFINRDFETKISGIDFQLINKWKEQFNDEN